MAVLGGLGEAEGMHKKVAALNGEIVTLHLTIYLSLVKQKSQRACRSFSLAFSTSCYMTSFSSFS